MSETVAYEENTELDEILILVTTNCYSMLSASNTEQEKNVD